MCRCGSRGCLEAYTSGGSADGDDRRPVPPGLSLDDIIRAARRRRRVGPARARGRRPPPRLGPGQRSSTCSTRRSIVVGGDMARAGELLLEPARIGLRRHALDAVAQTPVLASTARRAGQPRGRRTAGRGAHGAPRRLLNLGLRSLARPAALPPCPEPAPPRADRPDREVEHGEADQQQHTRDARGDIGVLDREPDQREDDEVLADADRDVAGGLRTGVDRKTGPGLNRVRSEGADPADAAAEQAVDLRVESPASRTPMAPPTNGRISVETTSQTESTSAPCRRRTRTRTSARRPRAPPRSRARRGSGPTVDPLGDAEHEHDQVGVDTTGPAARERESEGLHAGRLSGPGPGRLPLSETGTSRG